MLLSDTQTVDFSCLFGREMPVARLNREGNVISVLDVLSMKNKFCLQSDEFVDQQISSFLCMHFANGVVGGGDFPLVNPINNKVVDWRP